MGKVVGGQGSQVGCNGSFEVRLRRLYGASLPIWVRSLLVHWWPLLRRLLLPGAFPVVIENGEDFHSSMYAYGSKSLISFTHLPSCQVSMYFHS